MHIAQALKWMDTLECRVSELYDMFSADYADDEEVSTIFCRLCVDEKCHQDIVQYERRLVSQNPKHFDNDSEVDVVKIQEAIESIEQLMASEDALPVKEAVAYSIKLELDTVECYYKTAIQLANPSTAKLINGLGMADREHMDMLMSLSTTRGWR